MIAMVVMQGRCRRDLRHVRWRAHALVLLDCAVMQVEKSDTPSPGDRSGSIDDQLGALRRDIDSVDRQIVELLNRRASLAQHVGEVKKLVDAPVYRPEREAQIFARPGEASKACRSLKGAQGMQARYPLHTSAP